MEIIPLTNASGIYEIRNLKTNDFYIGSAANLKDRCRQHFTALKLGDHHNRHLQNSYNKHGKDAFVFKVLMYCDKNMLVQYEQDFIDRLKPTYNKRLRVETNAGIKRSDEYKRRSSEARKGKPIHTTPEWINKLRNLMKGNTFGKGIKPSPETIAKRRTSMLGKNKGKKPSQSCRDAVSRSNKTRIVSEETRRKMSVARRGQKRTEETRQKISEAKKKYYASLKEKGI